MSSPAIPEEDLQALRAWARDTVEVQAVWVFGSRVRGEAALHSDLVVAVQPCDCTDACCNHQRVWRQQLAGRTRLRLDVWEYCPERDDRLREAIATSSIEIFRRD